VTYNVKYFMNGSEKGVLPQVRYLNIYYFETYLFDVNDQILQHIRLPGDLGKREVQKVQSVYEPEDFEEKARIRAEVASRRLKSQEALMKGKKRAIIAVAEVQD